MEDRRAFYVEMQRAITALKVSWCAPGSLKAWICLTAFMCPAQITIMYSNPVLVALLAWALRGEVLSLRGCLGIAVTLLGVVVVAQPPFLFGGHEWSPTRLAGEDLYPQCLSTNPLPV